MDSELRQHSDLDVLVIEADSLMETLARRGRFTNALIAKHNQFAEKVEVSGLRNGRCWHPEQPQKDCRYSSKVSKVERVYSFARRGKYRSQRAYRQLTHSYYEGVGDASHITCDVEGCRINRP